MIKLVLVLISLANLCLANSIFKTDIKLLDYLSTEYDFFANNQPDLTCFTCDQSKSNEQCNKKAIDEPCSQQIKDVDPRSKKPHSCLTVHQFNAQTLETIYIEKKCIQNCSPELVGCQNSVVKLSNSVRNQHVRTCSYCCSKTYCNLESVNSVEQSFNMTDILTFANSASGLNINYVHLLFVCLLILSCFFQ